ncbi:MAG: DUF115 domain-containing protein [Treponema sp.]|nr:DUF115 domain-containing protein [Treponema sp.]
MTDSIYSEFIEAKDGTYIPLLKSGKTLESRYNPQRDAENIINNLDQEYSFFIILGIGSGLLIKNLFERFANCKIISVELNQSDYDFLKMNENTKNILSNKNLIEANKDNLNNLIINNYIPAKYGNIKIIEQKNWLSEIGNYIGNYKEKLFNDIQKAINIISADFSVQAHFGKIWTCNILNNVKLISKNKNKVDFSFDIQKKALIVAAGPSLDKEISYIKDNKDDLFIISTDTAFNSLLKNEIEADLVVSLDAQSISHNHFINSKLVRNTCFAFDLCGNSSAAKHIIEKGYKHFFFISGHPLSTLFNYFTQNSLIKLEAGAGTVTLAALDFAIKAAFKNIEILGADFGYTNGKAYTKGSYLDNLYNFTAYKINSSEKQFDNLLFRTELKQVSKTKFTTQILEAYKYSLIDFLNNHKLTYNYKNDIYYIENNSKSTNNFVIKTLNYDISFLDFINFLKDFKKEEVETALLPYISWLRKKSKYENLDYGEFLKLAHSFIVSYN